jgi:hypothetical protein
LAHAPERLHEEITAVASGWINMRKVDGWQTLDTKPITQPIDLAA